MIVRKPAVFVTIAFISGIILANHFELPSVLLLICLTALLTLILLFYLVKLNNFLSLILILCFLLGGFFLHELKTKDFPGDHVTHFLDLNRKVSLSGIICKDPDIRENKTFLTIETESIFLDDKFVKISGRVLIQIKSSTNRFNYGDYVRVVGYLRAPYSNRNPGAFDYKKYLARSRIFGLLSIRSPKDVEILFREKENPFLSYVVYPAKHFILKVFRTTLRGTHQALLSGFVLGERRDIPDRIYKMFTDTGTLHLLAISGSNVGLVVLFFFGFFRLLRVSRKLSILFTLPAIVIFSYVTNNQPSVVRASIMAIIFLLAFFWEREKDLINILAFSALLILILSPLSLFDVGFQLSFGVTLGLILFIIHPDSLFHRIAFRFKGLFRNWIILPIFVSLVAQISSYPILAYHFNEISLYAFLANLLVVPLVGLAVITGSMTVIAGVLSIKLAQILSAFNWVVLGLTLRVVEFFSHLPHATVDLPSPSFHFLIVYYLFFIIILIDWSRKAKRIGFVSLIFLSIFTLGREVFIQKDRLEITFLDVGQGQSILIELPPGKKILIDTGPGYKSSDAGERVVVPYLIKKAIKEIDQLILTSERNQFNGGLESVLGEIKIKEGIILGSSEKLTQLLRDNNVPYRVVSESLDLDGEVKIFTYLPDKKEEGYLLTLEHRDFRALFLNSEPERNIRDILRGENFDLMSTTLETVKDERFKEMVGLIRPQLIILSDYKYPWQELDLNRFGPETRMFWTKDRGAIRVTVRRAGFKLNWMLGEKRSKDFKLR
jgi:competence protein ComEC